MAGDPDALVARIDALLLHGTLSPAARDAVVTAVPPSPPTTRWPREDRVLSSS